MKKNAKILIAGSAGMVGSAIVRRLLNLGYTNLLGSYYSRLPDVSALIMKKNQTLPPELRLVQVDFIRQGQTELLFKEEMPDYVFLAAAKVGGIQSNRKFPAQYMYENLAIQNNIIHAAYQFKVKRLLLLGSSCIYPKLASQPLKEEYLLSGYLETTNEAYAIAKISGIKMCEAYNRQYGARFMAVMPTNLYGPNDNFDIENSHVLPALLRKTHEAKLAEKDSVIVWGTGSPRREFLHVDDMADASLFVMNLDERTAVEYLFSYPTPCFINVGCGVDCTIRELAEKIKDVVGFSGELIFDTSKPDGAPQKLLDVSLLNSLGWKPSIPLKKGIHELYRWYLKNRA